MKMYSDTIITRPEVVEMNDKFEKSIHRLNWVIGSLIAFNVVVACWVGYAVFFIK